MGISADRFGLLIVRTILFDPVFQRALISRSTNSSGGKMVPEWKKKRSEAAKKAINRINIRIRFCCGLA